jgi:uncharacterized protein (TIGR02001 family)
MIKTCTIQKAGVAAAVIISLGLAATGALAEGGTFSGSAGAASQYIFRGAGRSHGNPAVQGSLNYAVSGFHVGAWGSSGNYGNDGHAEVDLTAGYGGALGGYTYDLTLVGYTFPGDGVKGDYVEGIATLGRDFGLVSGDVGFGYTPSGQQAFQDRAVYYIFSDMDVPIPRTSVTAGFHIGYQDFGASTLTHWTAGLFTRVIGLNVGLQYVDTDKKGPGLGGRALVTVTKNF